MEPIRGDECVEPAEDSPNEISVARGNEVTAVTNRPCNNVDVNDLSGFNASVLRCPDDATLNQVRLFRPSTGYEFVKKTEQTPGIIEELNYCARLTLNAMDIKLHSEGCLLLVNNDLLAKVTIQQPQLLDETIDFKQAKQVLLEQIRVKEVYFDYQRSKRNQLRTELMNCLTNVGSKSAAYSQLVLSCFERGTILENASSDSDPVDCRRVCEKILQNQNFPTQLSSIATKLYEVECFLARRDEIFPLLSTSPELDSSDLVEYVKQFQSTGNEFHKKYLLEHAPQYLSHHLENVSLERVMLISAKDVEFFASLLGALNKDLFRKPLNNLASRFVSKVNSMQNFDCVGGNLFTNNNFILLCKSLQDLMHEISQQTYLKPSELIKCDATGWHPVTAWYAESNLTKCLKREYLFMFLLLKHFEPGPAIASRRFEYAPNVLVNPPGNSVPLCDLVVDSRQATEQSYVWYCLMDDVLSSITTRSKLADYEDVLEKLTSLLRRADDHHQFENVGKMIHALLKFISGSIKICEQGEKQNSKVEKQILQDQLRLLVAKVSFDAVAMKQFCGLADVFVEFWINKANILASISPKMSLSDMNQIENALLNAVSVALGKNVENQQLLEFFNVYNDFLKRLNEVSFDWHIQAIPGVDMKNLLLIQPRLLNRIEHVGAGVLFYQITDPAKFVQILPVLYKDAEIPKHRISLAVKKHLDLIVFQLKRSQWPSGQDISDSDQITTTISLISMVADRLPDLNKQLDCDSSEASLASNLDYLSTALKNSNSKNEFKIRVWVKEWLEKNWFYIIIIFLLSFALLVDVWNDLASRKEPESNFYKRQMKKILHSYYGKNAVVDWFYDSVL
ncbi:uncharacterized protein LOC131425974 [Malaya genurostris]|uniref:uncharacterized protein LOC131425974 n=1 Tax=Malaya genurostris TaxID=325434 RepID=UPI0026F3D340|nr:uncharacterized protein LOC131425974 [Malaya genurostris]XP_058444298.1 uncharacterized protein LOC131425974 [Malaya genurostris]XP_058444299.1 uncharacterized protein LOC131425974 [Malaya genurostris]XP_058444300.1 uncharacterized protein LOC131425974 [Malaya genurostris]XP_058444301.1 uncharacterized protein LOC131425974 [Malaya genurostris]